MAEIEWTKLAKEDLQEIYDYICKDSELYAWRLTDKIIERIEILRKNIKAGKVVPEFEDETIRELIEGSYRIIYQILGEKAFIVRIYHGARLLK